MHTGKIFQNQRTAPSVQYLAFKNVLETLSAPTFESPTCRCPDAKITKLPTQMDAQKSQDPTPVPAPSNDIG